MLPNSTLIKKTIQKIELSDQEHSISISKSIDELAVEWSNHAGSDMMFSVDFFRAIEAAPPGGMEFAYVMVYDNTEKLIGLAHCQIRLLHLSDNLRVDKHEKGILAFVKKQAAKRFKVYTLICGNALVTGDYGLKLLKPMSSSQRYQLQECITDAVAKNYDPKNKNVRVAFMKDFHECDKSDEKTLKSSAYHSFSVQPNMTLSIPEEWNSFDDYLGAMKSKYRVRVRRAKKKAEKIVKEELDLDQLWSFKKEIHQLYRHTAESAGFNLFYLSEEYFWSHKKTFGDKFKVYCYRLEGKMVGFYSIFHNNGEMEAHFLGYDPNHNAEHQLYLNMLYDLVEQGINNRHKIIHLSRTALEIKSSIGAVEENMYIYLKHFNKPFNKFVPRLLDYFVPQEKWVARRPFKS